MDKIPSIVMSGYSFNRVPRICVYEWIRGDEWLYVGSTVKGFGRIFGHDKIGKLYDVLDTDVIVITEYESEKEARIVENKLIRAKRPKFNIAGNWDIRFDKCEKCACQYLVSNGCMCKYDTVPV